MLRNTMTALFAALLLVWVVGCSDNPLETAGDTSNLTEDFGGYSATDESAAFGDSELLADEGDEEAIDDPILATSAMVALTDDLDAGMFHFRAVWGMIPYDSTIVDATDWTGSLMLTRGGMAIRRLVHFEPDQDYTLERTDRTLVEWVSATTIHNDGIVVDVYVPPMRPTYDSSWVDDGAGGTVLVVDTVMPEPVTLTFETGPYTRTFTLDELAALDEVVELDDGNKVALNGFQMFRQKCARGILAGHWGLDEEGNGVFRGYWFSGNAHVDGYLRGHYGQNDEGLNVFYGKWINRNGRFEGLLRGTWSEKDRSNNGEGIRNRPSGKFSGRIYDAERNPIGMLGGHFHTAPNFRGGWFQGRWKLICDDNGGRNNGIGMLRDGFDPGGRM
jgi:hypothetical protein